jgi:hypothetical protein
MGKLLKPWRDIKNKNENTEKCGKEERTREMLRKRQRKVNDEI